MLVELMGTQLLYAVFIRLINIEGKCQTEMIRGNSFVWKADILILLLLALLSCREVTFQHLDYFAISQRTYVFIKSSTYVKRQMLRDLRVCGLRVGRLTLTSNSSSIQSALCVQQITTQL